MRRQHVPDAQLVLEPGAENRTTRICHIGSFQEHSAVCDDQFRYLIVVGVLHHNPHRVEAVPGYEFQYFGRFVVGGQNIASRSGDSAENIEKTGVVDIVVCI